jgi:two-component system OmpR family response regulator
MIHGTLQKCNLADDSKNAIRKPGLKRRPGQEGAASQETYILIVEDSEEIGRLLVRGFQERGFNVVWKTTGQDAMTAASKQPPDVVVLDRMLPDGEGLELLTRWRAQGLTAPVIVLSALTAVEDRVAGLERGADDYLAKPFSFAELLARVRALLRRGVEAALTLQVGELKLDRRTRQVERRGAKIDHVWEPGVETATNVIDVYINRLRNKIDKGAERPLIQTVRGLGYVLNDS